MIEIQFIVPRPSESYAGIISAQVKPGTTPDDVMRLLSDAVTAWVNTTLEGKECWLESSEDMNIGDLDVWGIPSEVTNYLISHGIHDFKLEIRGGEDAPKNWLYDSIIYQSGTIPDDIPSNDLQKHLECFVPETTLNVVLERMNEHPPKGVAELRTEIQWLIAHGCETTTVEDVLAGKVI